MNKRGDFASLYQVLFLLFKILRRKEYDIF